GPRAGSVGAEDQTICARSGSLQGSEAAGGDGSGSNASRGGENHAQAEGANARFGGSDGDSRKACGRGRAEDPTFSSGLRPTAALLWVGAHPAITQGAQAQ